MGSGGLIDVAGVGSLAVSAVFRSVPGRFSLTDERAVGHAQTARLPVLVGAAGSRRWFHEPVHSGHSEELGLMQNFVKTDPQAGDRPSPLGIRHRFGLSVGFVTSGSPTITDCFASRSLTSTAFGVVIRRDCCSRFPNRGRMKWMSVIDQIEAERRARRRAGDPRLSEKGRQILLQVVEGDALAEELAAATADDPMMSGQVDRN